MIENPVTWLESTPIGQGKFLQLEFLNFIDRRGKTRRWETADRINSRGAAVMLAEIVPDGQLILIRQFRPPARQVMIELPAGLIDPEEDASETAVRELYEETGFQGQVKRVFPAALSTPGMSGERSTLVMMTVDGKQYRNGLPTAHQEENEDIETILVPKHDLLNFLEKAAADGYGIDAKLLYFAVALGNAL